MDKPIPENYGLTQKNLEYYQKQKELFDKEYAKHLAINEKISFFITWIISTIIVFIIIMLLVDRTIFKEKVWLIFVVPISAFFFPTLLILAITDGPYQFLDREKEIKARYFSIELERKYIEYQKALKEYEEYLEKCTIDFWNSLNGNAFEKEIAKLFRTQGYSATVTSATGDGGVDIILTKDGKRIAVQCKHHTKPVGPNDVRALQGVVASQNYSKGIFVSLNGYTSTVRQEVRSGNVQIELLELRDILQMAKGDCQPCIKQPDETQNSSTPAITEREIIMKLYEKVSDEDLPQLVGKSVRHKQFGEGMISDIIDRKYIEIYFFDASEYKKFIFPDAFADRYLVPVDFKIVRKE